MHTERASSAYRYVYTMAVWYNHIETQGEIYGMITWMKGPLMIMNVHTYM